MDLPSGLSVLHASEEALWQAWKIPRRVCSSHWIKTLAYGGGRGCLEQRCRALPPVSGSGSRRNQMETAASLPSKCHTQCKLCSMLLHVHAPNGRADSSKCKASLWPSGKMFTLAPAKDERDLSLLSPLCWVVCSKFSSTLTWVLVLVLPAV